MSVTVRDILMNADAFRRAYPSWPSAEPAPAEAAPPVGRPLVIPVIRGTATASHAEADLAERLAPWIAEQGIAEGEIAVAVAGSLVTSGGLEWAARSFGDGTGSQVLRDAAAGLASDAHLSLDEWAAENYWHGHGKRY